MLAPAGDAESRSSRASMKYSRSNSRRRKTSKLFIGQGHEPGGDTPEEYAAFIRAETEKWSKVAKAANIQKRNSD